MLNNIFKFPGILFFFISIGLGQTYVENFNNLDNWTNTTNGTQAWVLDANGYDGICAESSVNGTGVGDQLQRDYTFSSDATLSIWVKKSGNDPMTIYFKLDGSEKWSWGGSGVNGDTWTQHEITVSPGTHEIRIETDFGGTAWIDEMEIYEIADQTDLILDGQTINLSGSYDFETVSLTNNAQIRSNYSTVIKSIELYPEDPLKFTMHAINIHVDNKVIFTELYIQQKIYWDPNGILDNLTFEQIYSPIEAVCFF